jgi:hypothetical protein
LWLAKISCFFHENGRENLLAVFEGRKHPVKKKSCGTAAGLTWEGRFHMLGPWRLIRIC